MYIKTNQLEKTCPRLDWFGESDKMKITSQKNASRIEYEKRVNRVIDYISGHMDEDLSLEKLASVAAFSPYHFHRVFKSIVGENLNEFVQRVRIERAASSLINCPLGSVLEIALDNGFGSTPAFARAFKEHFGMSATEWRDGGAEEWSKIRKVDSKCLASVPRRSLWHF